MFLTSLSFLWPAPVDQAEARKPLWPVLLACGAVRVMVWFGVWMGHTWDLCLLYSGISIECAKCWMAKNNPSLTTMKSNAEHWKPRLGHRDRRSINGWGSPCHVPTSWQRGQLGLDSAAGEIITAYLITRGWKCCQPLSQCFSLQQLSAIWYQSHRPIMVIDHGLASRSLR